MINEIIEAISTSLSAEFPDEKYEFHMEEIRQDLKEPCFFIASLQPSRELFLGRRYEATNNFVIQYFPESRDCQRECNDVAERMTECLEYITTDGDEKPIRGTNMKHEVVDGVLNFFVNYDLFLIKSEETVPMEDLSANTTAR